MLITDYLVGRDDAGRVLCLAVDGAIPLDCQPGRSSLISKFARQDLILEFIQDGAPVDWVTFPDLPTDVCNLLKAGEKLAIVDREDDVLIECALDLPQRHPMGKVAGGAE